MTYWFNPEWKYPEAAKKALQVLNWTNEVKEVILRNLLLVGGVRGFDSSADTFKIADLMVHEIWDQVRDEPLWKDAELTKVVSKKSNRAALGLLQLHLEELETDLRASPKNRSSGAVTAQMATRFCEGYTPSITTTSATARQPRTTQ